MSIYNVREHTAKTVNQELHSLVRSLEKISRRIKAHYESLDKRATDQEATEWQRKLLALRNLEDRQQATLDAAIVAAKEGRTWRHRSQVNHFNHGQRMRDNMAPIWSVTNKA